MISSQLETHFRKLYKEYVLKEYSHLAKVTQNQYFTESLVSMNEDRGYDYWTIYGDEERLEKTIDITKNKWKLWTELYSESPTASNGSNSISGYRRINSFLEDNPELKDDILSENEELSKQVANLITSEYPNDSLVDLLIELTGLDRNRVSSYINDYEYLLGQKELNDSINNDLLFHFLDSFEKEKLDYALIKIKEYLKQRYEVSLYIYPDRYKELDDYSKSRNSNIRFSLEESKSYVIKNELDIENSYWLIFNNINEDEISEKKTIIWKSNNQSLATRIAKIQVRSKILFVKEIKVEDEYAKFFDKAQVFLYEGRVTNNPKNGFELEIEVIKTPLNKIWYYDTFKGDTSLIKDNNWKNKNLINYIQNKEEQDIDRYIKEFGKKQSIVDISENINDGSESLKENTYSKKDLLNEVYISEEQYNTIHSLLVNKKNLILQGAPGVGKTFMAKRLAYSLINEIDSNYVKQIQFHQSYGYEDLMMGYKPTEQHFELKTGPFYDICMSAIENPDQEYFFIIDEINRGNISKIFGELLMLIEDDKRGPENAIELMYSNESFYVPKNLYLIGLMNTADRSLSVIDYALRRRFSFYELKPALKNDKFKNMIIKRNNSKLSKLVKLIDAINIDILEDESLGSGFLIGHSYFTSNQEAKDFHVHNIIEYELIPLISEYWYDDRVKKDYYTQILRVLDNE